MTEQLPQDKTVLLAYHCDITVEPIQAIVMNDLNMQPFVHHGKDLARIKEQYTDINTLLFLIKDGESDKTLCDFFPLIPSALSDGKVASIFWRNQLIAISLHSPRLSNASFFIQKLTAVMAYARKHQLLRGSFIAQEEVQQHTKMIDEIDFSTLRDMKAGSHE